MSETPLHPAMGDYYRQRVEVLERVVTALSLAGFAALEDMGETQANGSATNDRAARIANLRDALALAHRLPVGEGA